jgi:hypothetical protein
MARRFFSPFCFSNCERGSRHHIHQQPPQAPRSPKSCSKSSHASSVNGRISSPADFKAEESFRLVIVHPVLATGSNDTAGVFVF